MVHIKIMHRSLDLKVEIELPEILVGLFQPQMFYGIIVCYI